MNIEFILRDTPPAEMLLADLVFCDVSPHDGIQETRYYDYLRQIGFDGIALFDDIHFHDKRMLEFWNSIELPKLDLTSVGHNTGTGAVFFGSKRFELA